MPSSFRTSRSGRHLDTRSRNGQIDHDVFEGLPVRRWSRQPYVHSQTPKIDDSEHDAQGAGAAPGPPELPMPRDSQLLPPISRALLRAARAGCIYIRSSDQPTDENGKDTTDKEDQAGAGAPIADRSFTSRKWVTLPKHLEPQEVEFLAKRRPGLASLYGGGLPGDNSSGTTPGPMRRTKFKRVDPETGNISIYEAWVPEGHQIEGEVTGDAQTLAEQGDVLVNSETPMPGTVVEGVGVVNSEGVVVAEAGSASVLTPPKRRPPPPKRKGKGIGKGRKKKVMFAPGEGADATTVHGVSTGISSGVDNTKEGQEGSELSIEQSGLDDDEDDGEEGDESDEGEGSTLDAKTLEPSRAPSGTESTDRPTANTLADGAQDIDTTDMSSKGSAPGPDYSSTEPQTSPTNSGPSQPGTTPNNPPPAMPALSADKAEVPITENRADTNLFGATTNTSEPPPSGAPEITTSLIQPAPVAGDQHQAPKEPTSANAAFDSAITNPSVPKSTEVEVEHQPNTDHTLAPFLTGPEDSKETSVEKLQPSAPSLSIEPTGPTGQTIAAADRLSSAPIHTEQSDKAEISTVDEIREPDALGTNEISKDAMEVDNAPAASETQPAPTEGSAHAHNPADPTHHRIDPVEPAASANETIESATSEIVKDRPTSSGHPPGAPQPLKNGLEEVPGPVPLSTETLDKCPESAPETGLARDPA